MTAHSHAEALTPRLRAQTLAACLLLVVLGVVSIAVAMAPTVNA